MNCIKFKVMLFLRSRQRRPTASGAALGRAMPAGDRSRRFSPAQLSWDQTWSAAPGLGSPVPEADGDTGVRPAKDHRDDWRTGASDTANTETLKTQLGMVLSNLPQAAPAPSGRAALDNLQRCPPVSYHSIYKCNQLTIGIFQNVKHYYKFFKASFFHVPVSSVISNESLLKLISVLTK